MQWDQEGYDDDTPNTVLTAVFSGPDSNGMATSASQSLVLREDEELEEELPRFLLKLRSLLEYSGVRKNVIDDLLNQERIESHLPRTVVDENFLSEEAEDEMQESSRKDALSKIMQLDHEKHISSVEVERRGMSNFVFHYRKGANAIRLPKAFFDDIFDSEMEFGFFGGDEEDEDEAQ